MDSKKIKKIIHSKGMDIQEVAKQLKITPETLSRNINGNPTIKTLQKIANVLNCELGDFFNKTELIELIFENKIYHFYTIEDLIRFAEEIKKDR